MTKLTATLKQMLNALAFADAGEHLPRIEKTRYLNQVMGIPTAQTRDAAPVPVTNEMKASNGGRQVALYMGSELPGEMMEYVLQTCARLKHGLTVLTFQSDSTSRALLKPYEERLTSAGIDLHLVNLTGDLVPGLTRYLRSHPEIAFLACKDTGYLGRSFLSGTERQNTLPVPVVLLEAQQGGVRTQNDTRPNQVGRKTSTA